jgi:hypothetical protein
MKMRKHAFLEKNGKLGYPCYTILLRRKQKDRDYLDKRVNMRVKSRGLLESARIAQLLKKGEKK